MGECESLRVGLESPAALSCEDVDNMLNRSRDHLKRRMVNKESIGHNGQWTMKDQGK